VLTGSSWWWRDFRWSSRMADPVPSAADPADPQAGASALPRPWWRRSRLLLFVAGLLILSYAGDLLAAGVFVAAGSLSFAGALGALARARVIEDLPTATIRGATQGRVELKARAAPAQRSTAPLSGEPCDLYHLVVERRFGTHKSNSWRRVAEVWSVEDWLELEDGTGACLLALSEASLETRHSTRREFDPHRPPGAEPSLPATVQAAVDAAIAAGDRVVITERRIPPGSDLYAIGLFRSVPSDATPFDDTWMDRVGRQGAAASAYARMLAEAALQATAERRAALAESWSVRMRRIEGIGSDSALTGTVMVHTLRRDDRPGRSFPLILSDDAEPAVVRSSRREALMLFGAGLGLVAVGVGVLGFTRPEMVAAVSEAWR